jgi:hypothetical protein
MFVIAALLPLLGRIQGKLNLAYLRFKGSIRSEADLEHQILYGEARSFEAVVVHSISKQNIMIKNQPGILSLCSNFGYIIIYQ